MAIVSKAGDVYRCPEPESQRDAIAAERSRVAREVHDGVLQVLAGLALQVVAASKLVASDPCVARARLEAIASQIEAEQAELRAFIHNLAPSRGTTFSENSELAAALEKLRRRAEQFGAVRVELAVNGTGVTRTLGHEVYRIVQEALANVSHHSHAQVVSVDVAASAGRVRITVSDDGVGFPFRGKYDLSALKARNWGPVSIRGRVAALDGELVLTSTPSGSTLDISLPLDAPHAPLPLQA